MATASPLSSSPSMPRSAVASIAVVSSPSALPSSSFSSSSSALPSFASRRDRRRKIMVALDASVHSRHALEWALQNLARDGDHFILVSVGVFPGTWGEFLSQAFEGAMSNRDKVEGLQHQAEDHTLHTLMDAASTHFLPPLTTGSPNSSSPPSTGKFRSPSITHEIVPICPSSFPGPPAGGSSVPGGATIPVTIPPAPRHALTRLCRDRDVALLVVGALGAGAELVDRAFGSGSGGEYGLGEDPVGSTAGFCVRFAGCPVLVVRECMWATLGKGAGGGSNGWIGEEGVLGVVPEE